MKKMFFFSSVLFFVSCSKRENKNNHSPEIFEKAFEISTSNIDNKEKIRKIGDLLIEKLYSKNKSEVLSFDLEKEIKLIYEYFKLKNEYFRIKNLQEEELEEEELKTKIEKFLNDNFLSVFYKKIDYSDFNIYEILSDNETLSLEYFKPSREEKKIFSSDQFSFYNFSLEDKFSPKNKKAIIQFDKTETQEFEKIKEQIRKCRSQDFRKSNGFIFIEKFNSKNSIIEKLKILKDYEYVLSLKI